jgi:hypothetical protein
MVDPATRERLKALYQALQDRVLEPDDPQYVPLFEDPKLSSIDPVEHMATSIEFASLESVQLFSGHRGTGKSTQLRRLKRRLERDPTYKVVICDMEDYLPMTDEVDVVDFLLAAAGALSEALAKPELLGADPVHNYWARFTSWLQSQKIEVSGLGFDAKVKDGLGAEAGLGVKLNLKTDPEFRKRVRERMKLHVGAFRAEVHTFVQESLKQLKARHGDDTQLVVIYDNIEHLRGTTKNAPEVAASVERLFRGHADALRFPFVHTIFTVPPWLRVQYTGTGNDGFDNYCRVPCVKVRVRPERPDASVEVDADGLDALWRVASKRGDMLWLLGDRAAFDELAWASGGHLRDLFRMLAFLAIDATRYGLPASAERRQLAIEELRSAYLGFTNQEASWLQTIDQTGSLDIDEAASHHNLARFLDTHVVLGYRNGKDWYGVHPLIREDVARRAAAWNKARAASGDS